MPNTKDANFTLCSSLASGCSSDIGKSETFSDQWHVRVYSHAACSSVAPALLKRIASQRQILVNVLEGLVIFLECSRHGMY